VEQITRPEPTLAPAAANATRVAYGAGKRAFDIVVSAILIVILMPLMLGVAVAIWLDSGTPLLYRCERVGRYGRPFLIAKFRTMKDGSHAHLEEVLSIDEERRLEWASSRKLKDDPRRTRVGIFLRRSSLDELPQLFNVLTGKMSLIGPRPMTAGEWHGRLEAEEILSVRPGITGLWQVSGRSEVEFEERLALEVEYVRRLGLAQDLSIAVRTVGAVISGRGAY